MKKFFIFSVCMFFSVCVSAKTITFSRWECSTTVSVLKDGSKEYKAHYRGKAYILTLDQYLDLEAGYDITLTIE
jgi:hypothetical protein